MRSKWHSSSQTIDAVTKRKERLCAGGICFQCNTVVYITDDNVSWTVCEKLNLFRISSYSFCPPFALMTAYTQAAWTPQVHVKPADLYYPGIMWTHSTTFLWCQRMLCLSQSSSAPINVECGWGQVTAAVTGLLGLPWFSSSAVKVLRCVWAHYPAAVRSQAKSWLK